MIPARNIHLVTDALSIDKSEYPETAGLLCISCGLTAKIKRARASGHIKQIITTHPLLA